MTIEGEQEIIALLRKLVAASQPRPALMSVEDVARELNVSVKTVYRQSELGELPAPIRIGALVRWKRTNVDQFLLERAK